MTSFLISCNKSRSDQDSVDSSKAIINVEGFDINGDFREGICSVPTPLPTVLPTQEEEEFSQACIDQGGSLTGCLGKWCSIQVE